MRLAVAIVGRGKVGWGLHRALRAAGVKSRITAARTLARALHGNLVVLAVRDGALPDLATRLAANGWVSRDAIVVHCAGALDAEVLAPLRASCAGVAQMHPMISFADPAHPPSVLGGHAHVAGDAEAVRRARRLCRAIGMVPRTFAALDRVAYHAAAGLAANGAAALAAAAGDLLVRAGARAEDVKAMIGPLLRSVAENVQSLGVEHALTGPVRRGDSGGVERHLAALRARAPELVPLYVACADAQLPVARLLGDAPPTALDAVARVLGAPARGGHKAPS